MKTKKRKQLIFITNRGVCRLVWFAIGQIVQLVLHAVFENFWGRQIPMCAAGGFILLFFFFCGSWITAREHDTETHYEDMQ